MSIILDLIVLAIVALFAFLSAKKGFVRTLIEIVGFVLVILFANSVSPMLSNATYDKLIEPAIIESVQNINIEENANLITQVNLPDFVSKILGEGIDLQAFQATVQENINNGVESAVSSASQAVIKPVVTGVITIIYALIIIVVLLIVVSFLATLINKLFSFSLIGKANKILGAVLGVIKGIIISAVFCSVVSLIVSLTPNGFLRFTPTAIISS